MLAAHLFYVAFRISGLEIGLPGECSVLGKAYNDVGRTRLTEGARNGNVWPPVHMMTHNG